MGAEQLNSHEYKIALAFATLDLPPNSSRQQAREAYRDLVQVWHPDRFGHNQRLQSQAEAKLRDINNAYEILEKHFTQKEWSSSEGACQTESHTSSSQNTAASKERQPAAPTTSQVNSSLPGWLLPLVGLVLLAALAWYFFGNQPAEVNPVAEPPVAVKPAPASAPVKHD